MIASLRRMRRCLETETAYRVAQLKLLERQPGNPFGIVCRPSQAGLIAAMAPRLPLSAYNRVRGLRAGFAGRIAPLRAWYAAAGVAGAFETVPGYWEPALGAELARLNYFQSQFEVCLAAAPQHRTAAMAAVERVDSPGQLEAWLAACEAWPGQTAAATFPATLRAGLGAPGWSIYLASPAGGPAAAILFMQEEIGYCDVMTVAAAQQEFAQALLLRCMADAAALGVELVCTQADWLSERQQLLVRLGLEVVFVRSLWTPLSRRG
jgi:hypothetical protein